APSLPCKPSTLSAEPETGRTEERKFGERVGAGCGRAAVPDASASDDGEPPRIPEGCVLAAGQYPTLYLPCFRSSCFCRPEFRKQPILRAIVLTCCVPCEPRPHVRAAVDPGAPTTGNRADHVLLTREIA